VEPIPSSDPMAGFRLASGRLDAKEYPPQAEFNRIAQPWDLKRGTQYNVLVEPGRTLVKSIARQSAVLVEAPECKTLSRARDRPIPGADRQPPRLRSDEHPEGLPGLSLYHQAQVKMGNEMFEAAIARAEQRALAGLGGLIENPSGSYGWKLRRYTRMVDRLKERAAKRSGASAIKFGVCYNCMLGGARYKKSGICYYGIEFEHEFWDVCQNLRGICTRTGYPHQSMKPEVEGGVVIRYPTEEEAEYPLLMVQGIARATRRFLEAHPKLRSQMKYDFLEIYSGPNAPTTMAVAEELGATEEFHWAELLSRHCGSWYHSEAESESDEDDDQGFEVVEPQAPSANGPAQESSYHLLEDEERIVSILRNLPTEEYYSLLRKWYQNQFPGARPDVLEHISELEEFFDVCIAIGFSLGINKMELLKRKVKLLGEIVTREGRMPDPAKVEAIRNWGSISSLKEVQEFLGTCNYSRHTMGPKYASAAEGLRRYVKGGDSAYY
jgi:hypothetical protein